MAEKTEYLIFIDNDLYTVKICNREEGHYSCAYRIVTDEIHKLYESSGKKILHRLIRAFNLHIDRFTADEIYNINNDLELISKKLNISCN